jgi:hypothetical protein
VRVATDQWPEIETPADGSPVVVTRPADREKFSVSTAWEGAKLKQTFTGQEGRQVNTYSLNADGKTLTSFSTSRMQSRLSPCFRR